MSDEPKTHKYEWLAYIGLFVLGLFAMPPLFALLRWWGCLFNVGVCS